jgi:ribosomal protein S27E
VSNQTNNFKGEFMSISCPNCHTNQVTTIDICKKTGATIGGAAGAYAGFTSSIAGARLGATVASFAGPVGIAAGGLTGAVIGALFGCVSGNTAGAVLGKAFDETLLDNLICLQCGYKFSQPSGDQ